MREQAGFLKYITQWALMRGQKKILLIVLPDFPGDTQMTPCTFQPGDGTQAGCFAAARGPEQRAHAAPWQVKLHIKGEAAVRQLEIGCDAIHG